nr:MAG: replication initiator protein [Microviridae sp.]
MCLYSRILPNPKYKPNKKNGGNIPPVNDYRVLGVPIGCGQCIECRKQKQREWQVRLQEDIKTNKNGKFITLTFSNESYKKIYQEVINDQYNKINKLHNQKDIDKKEKNKEIERAENKIRGYALDNQIATKAVRLFVERWRKKYKKSIRHWLVTELGHYGTENIHMHGIMWTDESYTEIRDKWQYGYIYPRSKEEEKLSWVNTETVNYITKYVSKQDLKHKAYRPIILTSSGIGGNYTKTSNANNNKYKEDTDETYRTNTGHKIALPKYYRNKIYTEEEREKLWIRQLNKEKRYILGEEIDISKNEDDYYRRLEEAQAKNKQLKYGDDKTIWKLKTYEEERRKYLQDKRIVNKK